MNRKSVYILLLLIIKATFSFSQNQTMDNTTKEIMLQGKEAIVMYAFTIIKEKMPELDINPEDYEIKVWANKSQAIVIFKRLIEYIPFEESRDLKFDITVDLIQKDLEEDYFHTFFIPSKAEVKKINFVKEHVTFSSDFDYSIQEYKDRYWINYENESIYGGYFINNITGEKSAELHGHYESEPTPENPFVENDPLKEIFNSTSKDEILNIIQTSANPNMDKFIEITDLLSVEEFEKIRNFILTKGDRRTYRNFDSNNPHYHFNDFHAYLNSEIGQKNINNDPEISDFNEITIHDWNDGAFDIQYYTIKIVRKGDIKNELIYVEEEMKENSVYLLNAYEKDLNLMLKHLKEHYLIKLRNKINTHR